MPKSIKKINIFDILVVFIFALMILAFIGSRYITPRSQGGDRVAVTVKVPADSIEAEANKQKSIFFNSVNSPVTVYEVKKDGEFLLITVGGDGKIEDGAYFFNGQRLTVGQKAEIHSTYFAQGKVVSVRNENK